MGVKWLPLALLVASGMLAVRPARAGFDLTTSLTDTSGNHQVLSISTTSNVQFTDRGNFSLECDKGGTFVELLEGDAYTGSNDPDPFNGTYTLTITINDYDVTTPGTLTFTGKLTGSLDNHRSTITNTFTGPTVKSVVLGTKTYTVTLLPIVSPGPPVAPSKFIFPAFVTCDPAGTSIAGVAMDATSFKAGGAVKGTLTLSGPAPRGGAVVSLDSDNAAALGLPGTVLVPEGQTSAVFYGEAKTAASAVQVSAAWNGTSARQTVSVGAGGLCGDVNGNGVVDISDIAHYLRAIAGLEPLPT